MKFHLFKEWLPLYYFFVIFIGTWSFFLGEQPARLIWACLLTLVICILNFAFGIFVFSIFHWDLHFLPSWVTSPEGELALPFDPGHLYSISTNLTSIICILLLGTDMSPLPHRRHSRDTGCSWPKDKFLPEIRLSHPLPPPRIHLQIPVEFSRLEERNSLVRHLYANLHTLAMQNGNWLQI